MQKIINDPNEVVEDMLLGFAKAHKSLVRTSDLNPRVLVSTHVKNQARVGIVSGGGSGHKPAFIGYCGENMVDAVAVGEIFSSPASKTFFDAFREADQGRGIACLYGNYAGDRMNVSLAQERAQEIDIEVQTVIANDDVASSNEKEKRRGVAGEIFMWKVAGAKANSGHSLPEVIAAAQKTIDNTRSIGIGLSPCTIPANGKPNFEIKPGTMEVGIGHHGEPGIRVQKLENAQKMAEIMTKAIIDDFDYTDAEVFVLVSGLGSTPLMELYILYKDVVEIFNTHNIQVYDSLVGNYFTSLDMNGVTLSLLKLDEDLKACMDAPVNTPALKVMG